MTARALQRRWESVDFLKVQLEQLQIALKGTSQDSIDLRGIPIGQHKSPLSLRSFPFRNVSLSGADFEFSMLSTRFDNSKIKNCNFAHCKLLGCSMYSSEFEQCSFAASRIAATVCNDAIFSSCSFQNASWLGSFGQTSGGRRAKFIDCDFSGCQFKQIEFRACHFLRCIFKDAQVTWCELHHLKYEGGTPEKSQFEEIDEKRIMEFLLDEGES